MQYQHGKYALQCHPETPPHCVSSVSAEISYDADGNLASYFVVFPAETLFIPAQAAALRTDGLWQSTCFEVFVKSLPGPAYREFNASPSGEWAAYTFSGYRAGMADLRAEASPRCVAERRDNRLICALHIPKQLLPSPASRFGLSAVIEEVGGYTSYWALAHRPDQPDFHHDACFAAQLAAPERP